MSSDQDWKDGFAAGFEAGIEANLVTRRTISDAAKDIISSRSSTFKARNGRVMSIEDDNGEMCWIVPFDEMFALETALETLPTPPTGGRMDENAKATLSPANPLQPSAE